MILRTLPNRVKRLGVIVGAVIVVLLVLFFISGGTRVFEGGTTNVAVEAPKITTPAPMK